MAYQAYGLTVDMDPVPRIVLRAGDYQYFLIHLSNASSSCTGTVSFTNLPPGLSSMPQSQDFTLSPGASQDLSFKVSSSTWAPPAVIRPTVTASGGEQVNFPDSLKTYVLTDSFFIDSVGAATRRSLKNTPLFPTGLLAYYSGGDGNDGYRYNSSVGYAAFWNEGIWIHNGGVKGKCVFGHNGLAYPRHHWSKIGMETLNNISHRRGTILFWTRKQLQQSGEINYAPGFTGDPSTTWQIGPNDMRGSSGEGMFGYSWSPQQVYSNWYLHQGTTVYKSGSNSFVGLRRYKSAAGLTSGFLEATYLAMRGDIYSVQALFDRPDEWQHVAVAWDAESAKLEIYVNGVLQSGTVKKNGVPSTDTIWYGAPFDVGVFCNITMAFVQVSDEGGCNTTDRDELYIYNRALSAQEIQANMQASMGGPVPVPSIYPHGRQFYDSLAVQVRSVWTNATIRYTIDGSDPTLASPVYAGPIVLTASALLKVRSFLTGFAQSAVDSAYFECLGPDVVRPAVYTAVSINNSSEIMVIFTKPVDSLSAINPAHYALSGGIGVTNVTLDNDRQTARLATNAAVTSATMISVQNVNDATHSGLGMDPLVDSLVRVKSLPGLVGYWNFDVLSGYTVKDLSPSRVNGMVFSDIYREATYAPGKKGQGLLFGGDDFYDVTEYAVEGRQVNSSQPLNLEAGTVAFWFKAASSMNTGVGYLVSKSYAYNLRIYHGTLYVGHANATVSTNTQVVDGAWHHCAISFSNHVSNGTAVYVDGALISTITASFLNNSGTGVGFGVGGGGYGQPEFFSGTMDEIMVFNRPLNRAEVLSLYNDSTELGMTAAENAATGACVASIAAAPNPFNPSTHIFVRDMPGAAEHMRIAPMVKIYSISGRLVTTLTQHTILGTQYVYIWDAKNMPSGVYVVKADVGNKAMARLVTLIR